MTRHSLPLWLLVTLWCTLIGLFALHPGFTADSTSSVIRQVVPGSSAPTPPAESTPKPGKKTGLEKSIEQVNHYTRKSAHFVLYSILGLLLAGALASSTSNRWAPLLAIPLGIAIASLDEFAQSFVPGRSGLLKDVMMDSVYLSGAALLMTWRSAMRPNRSGIVQAITLAEMGGAQKVLFSLLPATAGLWPTALVCGPGQDLVRWTKEMALAVTVHEMNAIRRGRPSPLADLRTFWNLLAVLRRTRPQMIHLHSSKMGILGRLAAWLTGVPVVLYTAHGWPVRDYHGPRAKLLYAWVERAASLLTDRVICVSESERQLALQYRLAPASKLMVIRNGVSQPTEVRGKLRALLSIGPDLPLVVAIGRLAEPKDPLGFIQLAAQTAGTNPDAHFVWLGDGPLRPACEQAIRDLGQEGRVFLLGTREDARDLLNDADVFVLPTKAEGLPLVVMEAMWAGKPVIASAVGGIPELVEDGVTGYLIPSGGALLADRLARLLLDGDLRHRMGEAGREKARADFSEERMVADYLAIYEAAMPKGGDVHARTGR